MDTVHPTALVHPRAQLDPTVTVGPYTLIDEHVRVGPNCVIGPHGYLTGHTTIGWNNRFHAGCVIGDAPQDLKYKSEPTRLIIGDNNVFREHVTIHRANSLAEDTAIGSNCFLMAHCHVGHNARVGNHVIVANGALLAGHVEVGDKAFISGNCLMHQFVRVGLFALMQGGAAISKDLPPYTIARGDNGLCGINVVGLRRAGFTAEQRLELKRLYHQLFRRRTTLKVALSEARKQTRSPAADLLIEFVSSAKRGLCADTGHFTEDEG